MRRFFCFVACVICGLGTAKAQTVSPGYKIQELKIQVVVPDDTVSAPTPTPAVPYQSQQPYGPLSANASAVGQGAHAYAGVDQQAFPGDWFRNQPRFGQRSQGGQAWQSNCAQQQSPAYTPQAQVTVKQRLVKETLTRVEYPPQTVAQYTAPVQTPNLLPNRYPCTGNLFGRCRCARHRGVGVGVNAGINANFGVGGYY